jgi:hypothetical protein
VCQVPKESFDFFPSLPYTHGQTHVKLEVISLAHSQTERTTNNIGPIFLFSTPGRKSGRACCAEGV